MKEMTITSMEDIANYITNTKVTPMNNLSCNNCNERCDISAVITQEEFNMLKKYFKTKEGKVKFTEAKKRFKKWQDRGVAMIVCPFTNSGKKCSIYDHRPKVCKLFHCDTNPDIKGKIDEIVITSEKHFTIFDLFCR